MIVNRCTTDARIGVNGHTAHIPSINIDVVGPGVFLGVGGNPAIFVSNALVARMNPKWTIYRTIVIRKARIKAPNVLATATLVHEMGHAFGHYAGDLKNNEANACNFEIGLLLAWANSRNTPLGMLGVPAEALRGYFSSRAQNYINSRASAELIDAAASF